MDNSPTKEAQSFQGKGKYPGIDSYTDIKLKKGIVLFRGEPNGTEYFTTEQAIAKSDFNATKLFEGLQVEEHPIFGYRNKMGAYIVNEEIDAAYGIVRANSQFGDGKLPQVYIPNVNQLIEKGILDEVGSIKLK
ncbi:hypothetical protein A0O21_04370 [Streptococcus pantholopis]|uniref:Uncharacterized protein n=1 Tax=Streptococcus pantholopis TaxID=1811193 RepID=A0A172QAI0_9STRE|nr:hypothetical protein A0O21_04370 [Streptococcus pantholopis]